MLTCRRRWQCSSVLLPSCVRAAPVAGMHRCLWLVFRCSRTVCGCSSTAPRNASLIVDAGFVDDLLLALATHQVSPKVVVACFDALRDTSVSCTCCVGSAAWY